jgi:hypothetical protein
MTLLRDRQKIESILTRRFPGASRRDVAAATNAIVGLDPEWEEVLHQDRAVHHHIAPECGCVCGLTPTGDEVLEFPVFVRMHRSSPERRS